MDENIESTNQTSPFGSQDTSTVAVPSKPVIQTIRPGDTTPDTTGDGTTVSTKPDRFEQKEMPAPTEEKPSRFNLQIPRQDLILYVSDFSVAVVIGFGIGFVLSSL